MEALFVAMKLEKKERIVIVGILLHAQGQRIGMQLLLNCCGLNFLTHRFEGEDYKSNCISRSRGEGTKWTSMWAISCLFTKCICSIASNLIVSCFHIVWREQNKYDNFFNQLLQPQP